MRTLTVDTRIQCKVVHRFTRTMHMLIIVTLVSLSFIMYCVKVWMK